MHVVVACSVSRERDGVTGVLFPLPYGPAFHCIILRGQNGSKSARFHLHRLRVFRIAPVGGKAAEHVETFTVLRISCDVVKCERRLSRVLSGYSGAFALRLECRAVA